MGRGERRGASGKQQQQQHPSLAALADAEELQQRGERRAGREAVRCFEQSMVRSGCACACVRLHASVCVRAFACERARDCMRACTLAWKSAAPHIAILRCAAECLHHVQHMHPSQAKFQEALLRGLPGADAQQNAQFGLAESLQQVGGAGTRGGLHIAQQFGLAESLQQVGGAQAPLARPPLVQLAEAVTESTAALPDDQLTKAVEAQAHSRAASLFEQSVAAYRQVRAPLFVHPLLPGPGSLEDRPTGSVATDDCCSPTAQLALDISGRTLLPPPTGNGSGREDAGGRSRECCKRALLMG